MIVHTGEMKPGITWRPLAKPEATFMLIKPLIQAWHLDELETPYKTSTPQPLLIQPLVFLFHMVYCLATVRC